MRRINNTKLCPILNSKIVSQSIEDLPVIVQFKEGAGSLVDDVTKISKKVKCNLPIIHGFAGNISTDIVYRLSSNPDIEFISFDSNVYTLLDIAPPSMKVDFPHREGFYGEGITIAVIDTGVAPHSDLVGNKNRIVGFKDLVNNRHIPYDDNGHGTHVSGIIAGDGYSSRGKYAGIAPKSNIVAIKALDENGGGSSSDIIAAISYVIEKKDDLDIKIVNLSLGTIPNSSQSKDPLCRAVDKAIKSGLVVVAAAGNNGPDKESILSPGISSEVITVGAVDDKRTIDPTDDTIATFSSRGPTLDGELKPDLVAPGVNIQSLSNSKLDSYSSLSGTSMATPLVTGSVALLFNKYGDLPQREVKKKLVNSCYDLKDKETNQGAGVLSLEKLFEENLKNKISPSHGKKENQLVEGLIVLVLILFLLDERI